MVNASYRFDEVALTIFPKEYQPNNQDLVFDIISRQGYEVREPTKDDKLRKAKSYNPSNARMILIGDKWYTLNSRMEWDENRCLGYSCFIVFSGGDLDEIDLRQFLIDFDGYSKATRFDIAVDLMYDSFEDMSKQADKLCQLVGFTSDFENGNKQNPENSIRSGRNNSKKPIKKASKVVSNGLTLYIGSRSSKYFMRMYDKSAEVFSKTQQEIPPTMRYEIEAKAECSEAVRKYIIKTKTDIVETARRVWQNLNDDNIMFYDDDKDKTFAQILYLDKARECQLDYSKIEGEKMEYLAWFKKQVSPSFRKMFADLSEEEAVDVFRKVTYGKAD